jgi:hypothetical protein
MWVCAFVSTSHHSEQKLTIYVSEFLLNESHPQSDDEHGDEAEAEASGSDTGSSSSAEYRPKKRRREVHGLEHVSRPLQINVTTSEAWC